MRCVDVCAYAWLLYIGNRGLLVMPEAAIEVSALGSATTSSVPFGLTTYRSVG